MRSQPLPVRLSDALKDTFSIRGPENKVYKISMKATKSSIISGVEYVACLGPTMKVIEILAPEVMDKYISETGTIDHFCRRYGVSRSQFYRALRIYREHLGDRLRRRMSANYAFVMKGNRRGARKRPSVLLDKNLLFQLVGRGLGTWAIASELKTTAFLVRQNMKHYGMKELEKGKGTAHLRFAHLPESYVTLLEAIRPGISQLATNFRNDRMTFFSALYEAHLHILDLGRAVKELSKAHAYCVNAHLVERSHICWSNNLHESILSYALLKKGIKHKRQIFIRKFIVDFLIGDRLIVEVDGSYHQVDAGTKRRDVQKERALLNAGYVVLRFTTKEVERNADKCVNLIIKSARIK